jgi:thioredoxin reductase (NADPH)
MERYDVVIIGGGPAGLTAGLYSSRAGLRSLLLERGILGGQMVNAALIENYAGFPDGISGSELGLLIHQQAAKYVLELTTVEVTGITEGWHYIAATTGDSFEAAGNCL